MSKETKEEMFDRIRQRMKNRMYLPTGNKSFGPSELVHDRTLSTMQMIHYIPGDDCFISDANSSWESEPLIADRTKVGRNCLVAKGVRTSFDVTFGSGALFEGDNVFHRDVTFGDCCIFGPGCTFGKNCKFGTGCVFLCDDPTDIPTSLKRFKMSEVDGSGREITVTIFSDWSVTVKAGCFDGTLSEFCKKASKEHKPYYSSIVKAATEAAISLLKQERNA